MKRALLKQMRNEWKGNLWIIAGLTIVSIAIWILCAQLHGILHPTLLPMGFNDENLYVMTIHDVKADADSEPVAVENAQADRNRDIRMLLEEYRSNPNVEVAGLSWNGTPYQRSWNTTLWPTDGTDSVGYNGFTKMITPEMVRVLGLKSATGKSADELEAILRRGEVLITTRPGMDEEIIESGGRHPLDLIGKKVKDAPDGEAKYMVGDVVDVLRESMFNRSYGNLIVPMSEEQPFLVSEIAVRVKAGHGDAFMEDFENRPEMQGIRSIYVSAPEKVSYKRMAAEQADIVSARLYGALICFVFVIIFLGLLGSFWFRVQQRVQEIAIRKVCGASRGAIFRRIIGEGLILLLSATVLSAAIAWTVMLKTDPGSDNMEMLGMEATAFCIVAVSVIVSLWWPAHRAMNTEPAIAIKEE